MADKAISPKRVVWIIVCILFALTIIEMVFSFSLGGLGKAFYQYIFAGAAPGTIQIQGVNNQIIDTVSTLFTILALWLIVFVTFGDILEEFSTFSEGMSWVIALACAIIAANLSLIGKIVLFMAKAFIVFGSAATFIGLAAAFVAFAVINTGFKRWFGWVQERRNMVSEQKNIHKMRTGEKVLKEVGEGAE